MQPGSEAGPVLDPAQGCGANPFIQHKDAGKTVWGAFPEQRETGPSQPKTRFVQILRASSKCAFSGFHD